MIRQRHVWAAECDGADCDAELSAQPDSGAPFFTRFDVIGAAYAAGWRFVARKRRDGSDGTGYESAVCPKCQPTFAPQPANDTWKNRRA